MKASNYVRHKTTYAVKRWIKLISHISNAIKKHENTLLVENKNFFHVASTQLILAEDHNLLMFALGVRASETASIDDQVFAGK